MIEQPLGALPVGGATVRPQALGKGAVNQGFFTGLCKRFIESAINRLPGDFLQCQFARQPLPPYGSGRHTVIHITFSERRIVNVAEFFEARDTLVNQLGIGPFLSQQALAQLGFAARSRRQDVQSSLKDPLAALFRVRAAP